MEIFSDYISRGVDVTEKTLLTPGAFRSLLVLLASIVAAYWLSKYIANIFVWLAKRVALRSDNATDYAKTMRLRQVETYLGVTVAVIRVFIVVVIAYIAWRTISPEGSKIISNSGFAAIGASAIFIVIAGQTVGTWLRDITAGMTMIAEGWFNVGDYIKVEPFIDVSGVVERLTLRSTRLRTISGEVIILHNQKIDGVHITPKGVRTMAVDIFVRDLERGEAFVTEVVGSLPTGPMMLAKPLKISHSEPWGEGMWHIVITGETPPGREWLIEKYVIENLKAIDERRPRSRQIMAYTPIARWADPVAEKRFTRAVKLSKTK